MVETNNVEMETLDLPPSFVRNMKRRQSVYVKANIDGFHQICTFHQICGLPYYDMKPQFNKIRSILGFVFSLSFIAIFIASLVPCMLNCDEENKKRYKSERLNRSQSSQIVQIILIGIEAYHTIDNDVGLMYARHEFQHFYFFLERLVLKHKISLNKTLNRRLIVTAWVLIILNVLIAILEIIFLYPIIEEEYHKKSEHHNAYIPVPKTVALCITLAIKAVGTIHSKALDSLIIYFTFLLCYYMRAYGLTVKELVNSTENYYNDYFEQINNIANSRKTKRITFDELKDTFISLEELIAKANDCLSPCILLTNTCNIIAIFGGVFIAIDTFGQGAHIEEEEAFQMFNAVVSAITLFLCAIFGDNIITETQNALRPLNRIRLNKITNEEYRSVKMLIDYIEDTKIESLSGTGFFRLDRRYLYQKTKAINEKLIDILVLSCADWLHLHYIWISSSTFDLNVCFHSLQIFSIIVPYMIVLSQKY